MTFEQHIKFVKEGYKQYEEQLNKIKKEKEKIEEKKKRKNKTKRKIKSY